jgi:hypothetical protein
MRVDVWDAAPPPPDAALDCGFPRGFSSLFELGAALGRGGFGAVRVARERATGAFYAAKSIAKRLEGAPPARQAQHLDNIGREAAVLRRLRGTLSVVAFLGAWEDDAEVHLVMEWCRGGELARGVGRAAHDEARAAAYCRSVLATLAQCHAHRILHRDVKVCGGGAPLLADSRPAARARAPSPPTAASLTRRAPSLCANQLSAAGQLHAPLRGARRAAQGDRLWPRGLLRPRPAPAHRFRIRRDPLVHGA